MIPEIGQLALVLCLVATLAQGILPLAGTYLGVRRWMAVARPAAFGFALFVTVAWACLCWSFVTSDFSVLNVAGNSNTTLPWYYRLAATWGSHEGSILLWAVMLAWWGFGVAVTSRDLPDETVARVLGVLGLVSAGIVLFMLATSNPFLRIFPPVEQGRDLNPLLQDPGMIFHPPLLYMGYVGMSVPFAFAVAALLSGRMDAAWARWTRPWTTLAWVFLTLGIMLGSWWSYYELGWGGWWFWDPVENASFMPWLTGTALIHSLAVTEKRGCFKIWTVLLAIITFSLSLLGTFLVRSGVLTSVHAFATDPERGIFILALLLVVIGSSFILFAMRAPTVGLGGRFALISRESMLLVNNVLIAVAMAAVLLGTLYPLFLDALNAGKISVGPPYFDSVFGPLMVPMVFLMACGPLARWKEASLGEILRSLAWCLAVSAAAGVAVPLFMGHISGWTFAGIFLAFFVLTSNVEQIRQQVRNRRAGLFEALASQPRAWWGMVLAHVGVALFIVGVTMVKAYENERDVRMNVGESITVAGYDFRFDGTTEGSVDNYHYTRGKFTVLKGGKVETELYPEKRTYSSQRQMPMTEASIVPRITGDLYVSLGEPAGEGWVVRAYWKPFVDWIWAGCIVMAIGGLLAMMDKRYRRLRRRAAQQNKEAK